MDISQMTKEEFLERYGNIGVKFYCYNNYNFTFSNYGKKNDVLQLIFVDVCGGNQYLAQTISVAADKWQQVKQLKICSGTVIDSKEIKWFKESQAEQVDLSKYKKEMELPYIRKEKEDD